MNRITINPQIRFGKPIVNGTRITVQEVLELVNESLTFDQIIQDYYPDLSRDDIHVCVEYAIELAAAGNIHISSSVARG